MYSDYLRDENRITTVCTADDTRRRHNNLIETGFCQGIALEPMGKGTCPLGMETGLDEWGLVLPASKDGTTYGSDAYAITPCVLHRKTTTSENVCLPTFRH